MVYWCLLYLNNYSIHGAFVNQHSHHWGGPHCMVKPKLYRQFMGVLTMINGILLMFIGNSLDFDHQKFEFDGILSTSEIGFKWDFRQPTWEWIWMDTGDQPFYGECQWISLDNPWEITNNTWQLCASENWRPILGSFQCHGAMEVSNMAEIPSFDSHGSKLW